MSVSKSSEMPLKSGGDNIFALVVLVTGFAALAWAMHPDYYTFEATAYLVFAFRAALYLGVLLTCLMGVFVAPSRPLSWAIARLRRNFFILIAGLILFAVGLAAFTTFKHDIPTRVPFYADRILDHLDRMIHGTAPFNYTHALISGQLEVALFWVYGWLWYLLWFGLFVVAVLSLPSRLRTQYLWTHALIVLIIGTILALGLSSYGPIFWGILNHEPGYEALAARFAASDTGQLVNQMRDYLLFGYRDGSPEFGAGISAMPSMHVALATMNVLFLSRLSKWLIVPGIAFLLAILVGSVHFGWHYAVDGYVSLIIVPLIWKATGYLYAPVSATAPHAAPEDIEGEVEGAAAFVPSEVAV